jgi:hypothetical protein
MPQVDIATFFDIALWTAIVYVGGFAILNLHGWAIPTFFETLKVAAKRLTRVYATAAVSRRQLSAIQLFPWISL